MVNPAPEAEQPKIPSKFGKKEGANPEGPNFRSDVNTVNLDVAVVDNKGNFIPRIPRKLSGFSKTVFRKPYPSFGIGEGAMTVCMVIEFSNLYQRYWTETWYQTLTASYGFLETLKPEDYVAVVAYDLRPEILSDFSTNKQKAYEAMQRLRIPAFSESNLFDALVDTAERMNEIEGRKAIVLLSTGVDTFSKLTFDKTRKALQNAGVPIYGIGLMQTYRELWMPTATWARSHGSTSCRRTIRCGPSPRKLAACLSSRDSTASFRAFSARSPIRSATSTR